MKPADRSSEVVLLYVPCASEDEAARLAHALLGEKLIACGNIVQSRSMYEWEGDVVDSDEHLLLCKTTPSRAAATENRVRELHSYQVPCILRLEPAQANYQYAAWVQGQVIGPSPRDTDTASGAGREGMES